MSTTRWLRRRAGLALAALPLGALACHAGLGGEAGAPAAGAAVARPRFSITERAETGPVTAIAFRAPMLYAGTAHGLRRWDVTTDEYEALGADVGLPGHGVTALGVDGEGNAWVATEAGVGRIVRGGKGDKGDNAGKGDKSDKYQPVGRLAGITALAPTTDGRGAWAGGAEGLYRSDGAGWTPVAELRGIAVTSLDLDRDGRSAWVGTRAQGLFRVEGDHARSVPTGDSGAPDEIVGTALTAVGTRVLAARALAGDGARLVFLEQGEPQAFRAQPEVRVVRLVDSGQDAVLVAGAVGAERAFSLQLLRAGEPPPPGALRFVSVKKGTAGTRARDRWAAVPLDAAPPPGVTVAAGGEGAVYYGTARRGVARGAKPRPAYLSGAELVGDAERLHVECTAPDRCFVVTDGPRAWVTDGDTYRETRVGEAEDATVLAVVADRAGTIYALSAEPKYMGLVISRLVAAATAGAKDAAGVDQWKAFERVPVVLPGGGAPGLSFAAVSPRGVLWLGLRARSEGGDDVSAGAVELDLPTHHVVQHRALRAGEKAAPEMLPLPTGLTGVLFDDPALWFSSLAGVSRWQQGELRTWGENEGLRSELVHGVAKAGDALWAATSEGVARFDGKTWRMRGDGEESIVATRGLARDAAGAMWVATARGLRLVGPEEARTAGAGEVVVAGDMRDVSLDRYGRLWALSSDAIALIERPTK